MPHPYDDGKDSEGWRQVVHRTIGPSQADPIRRFYEVVLSRGDLQLIDELFSPDFVDYNPMPGQQPGIEGLRQSIVDLRKMVPDLRFKVASITELRGMIIARWTASGTLRVPRTSPLWFLGQTELVGTSAVNLSRDTNSSPSSEEQENDHKNHIYRMFGKGIASGPSEEQTGRHLIKLGTDNKIEALWMIPVEQLRDIERYDTAQRSITDGEWSGPVGPPPPGPPWIPPEPEPTGN
jgi:hypothetical protein